MQTIVNELLISSSVFSNVTPVNREFVENNKHSLEFAHSGTFKNIFYAVFTSENPYQQYMIVIDLNKCEVIS